MIPPSGSHHPRGWATDRSHERKLRSYHVELAWYEQWSSACAQTCRVPGFLAGRQDSHEFFLVLEDLDASGYAERRCVVDRDDLEACIRWLACFHATFVGHVPSGLWEQGCYWHLATRPDELQALDDEDLKSAASAIDAKLNSSPFQTFVHGDAKLANFCFGDQGVAAVDFQYVGGGCGMKDLAYFVGSCLNEDECERMESQVLSIYFGELARRVSNVDTQALEASWRSLYPYAWTDFRRFLKGWSPGHWKINSYSERVCRQVLEDLCN